MARELGMEAESGMAMGTGTAMENIRKATVNDLSRIAEILVFVKRIKYRPIFKNDAYSFGELQVLSVAEEYSASSILDHIWVYDDGIVKGMIHIEDREIRELYVDYFFQEQGVGTELITFAIRKFHVTFLWALEKNTDAIRFYERHGFFRTDTRKLEEGTTEFLILLSREPEESVKDSGRAEKQTPGICGSPLSLTIDWYVRRSAQRGIKYGE